MSCRVIDSLNERIRNSISVIAWILKEINPRRHVLESLSKTLLKSNVPQGHMSYEMFRCILSVLACILTDSF